MSERRHREGDISVPRAGRHPFACDGAGLAVLMAILLGAAGSCLAQDAAKKKSNTPLDEVVVQGTREAADEQITRQVESALTNDPWIYAQHVILTTRNGIVRVEGITSDAWEMRRILRECRRTPGVRRCLNQLEMIHLDPDGG